MLHQEESSPALRRLQMHHTIFLKRKMGYSSDKARRTGINDEVKEKTNKQLDRKEENQPFDDPRRRRRRRRSPPSPHPQPPRPRSSRVE